MIRSELNTLWIQTILYYCFIIGNNAIFDINGSTVGTWEYDNNNDLIISTWIPETITQPTINNLLSYDVEDVTVFYTNYYVNPTYINDSQPFYKMSYSEISAIPSGFVNIGYCVFDTTNNTILKWNGSSWIEL